MIGARASIAIGIAAILIGTGWWFSSADDGPSIAERWSGLAACLVVVATQVFLVRLSFRRGWSSYEAHWVVYSAVTLLVWFLPELLGLVVRRTWGSEVEANWVRIFGVWAGGWVVVVAMIVSLVKTVRGESSDAV